MRILVRIRLNCPILISPYLLERLLFIPDWPYSFCSFGFVQVFLNAKELSFCNNLWFSNFNIVATQCWRPLIFQIMNAVRSYNVSLKYLRFTSSGCEDCGLAPRPLKEKSWFLTIYFQLSIKYPALFAKFSLFCI